MSSSLTTDLSSRCPAPDDVLAALGAVPEPRDPRGVRHPLPVILAVTAAAVLAGAPSFTAIGESVADQGQPVLAGLGVSGSARPTEPTIRRVLARVDADALDRVIGAFVWVRTAVVAGRRVIAIDGKTVRGARSPRRDAPHLVAAFDHAAGTILGQVAVAAKSNEIPAVRTLLGSFELTGPSSRWTRCIPKATPRPRSPTPVGTKGLPMINTLSFWAG